MNNTEIIIAPGINDTHLSSPPTFEEKLNIFQARMRGWKLNIVDQMINGYQDDEGHTVACIPEAAYAALDIMFTYFEPMGKYLEGYTGTGKSGDFFKKGVHSVFPNLTSDSDASAVKFVEDTLWKAVRCGIYHSGMTQGSVAITGEVDHPIVIPSDKKLLIINPHILVKALTEHLGAYVQQVRADGATSPIGQAFEARWNHDNQ